MTTQVLGQTEVFFGGLSGLTVKNRPLIFLGVFVISYIIVNLLMRRDYRVALISSFIITFTAAVLVILLTLLEVIS